MAVKNKKVATGIGVAAAAAAVIAIGAGTYAGFSDTRSGPGGSADAGTLFFGESTSNQIGAVSDIAPGHNFGTPVELTYSNGGDLTGNFTLDFDVVGAEDGCAGPATAVGPEFGAGDTDCAETDGPNEGELKDQIQVTVNDGSSNIFTGSVQELEDDDAISRSLAEGASVTYTLTFTFPDTGAANNQAQGDSVELTSTANLVQQ